MAQGTPPLNTQIRRGRGRPPVHGLYQLRKAVTRLGTRRLDGRSAVAVAARRFKADLTADLGGDPSRAQATLIELAARTWIIVEALDDWIMRQPSLVLSRKRSVVPVLLQRQQLADSLARLLERLGLERKAKDPLDLATYLSMRQPASRSESPQERRPSTSEGIGPAAADDSPQDGTEAVP
jgi:hypothetical protein